MIVIDLGCATHGAADSVGYLVERFHPDVLFGFDPLIADEVRNLNGTVCVLSSKAAWTHDDLVTFYRDEENRAASRSWDDPDRLDDPEDHKHCFDVADFIQKLPQVEIVLKLDCEGAEYPILQRLYDTTLDHKLSLVLVEWHSPARIELRCPVEEWVM